MAPTVSRRCGSLATALIGRLGEGGYKGLYAVVSIVGFVLIAYGFATYRAGGYIQVWDPPTGLRHVALLLMWPAFIALVAAYSPGAIKRRLKHPMLVAVKIWALAHLLANGDLGSIILFGAFLAWAVYDRIAVKKLSWSSPAHWSRAARAATSSPSWSARFSMSPMMFLHPDPDRR